MSGSVPGQSGERPRLAPDLFDTAALRTLVFLAVCGVILGGPFYHQVLGGTSAWLRPWGMYHGNGINTVTVEFEWHRNGTWEPFDVVPELKARLGIAPQELLRIDNEAALAKVKLLVCHAFPHARMRFSAHQADRVEGWRTLAEREPLACPRAR